MLRSLINLDARRTTGLSHLDERTQGLRNPHYKGENAFIARVHRCGYFVLGSALLLINLFCSLEQWTVCHGRLGNSAVNTCY